MEAKTANPKLQVLFIRSRVDVEAATSTSDNICDTENTTTSMCKVNGDEYEDENDEDDENICVICLETLRGKCVTGGTTCSHCFHHDCFVEWIERDHADCPQCRRYLFDPRAQDIVVAQLSRAVSPKMIDCEQGIGDRNDDYSYSTSSPTREDAATVITCTNVMRHIFEWLSMFLLLFCICVLPVGLLLCISGASRS